MSEEVKERLWGDEPANNFNPETGLYGFIQTGGDRNWVRRCQRIKKTGEQCKKWCIKTSPSGKCKAHGGRHGAKKGVPKTAEHIANMTKHGRESVAQRETRRDMMIEMKQLEIALKVIADDGAIVKTKMRVPNGVKQFANVAEAKAYLDTIGYMD